MLHLSDVTLRFHIISLFVITWLTTCHMFMNDHSLKFYFRGHVVSLIIAFLPKERKKKIFTTAVWGFFFFFFWFCRNIYSTKAFLFESLLLYLYDLNLRDAVSNPSHMFALRHVIPSVGHCEMWHWNLTLLKFFTRGLCSVLVGRSNF
jgi:hypothetical protein